MRPESFAACLAMLLGSTACEHAPVRAVVFEQFSLLEASAADEHYQQFVQRGPIVVDLGCFVVQRRQVNCFDSGGNGQPNLYLAVVECECPCVAEEPDPCDATRPMVRTGAIRGIVDQEAGSTTRGGVELPTNIDLADATWLFVTRERNDDIDPAPGTDTVLGGPLLPEGEVLRGQLHSPTRQAVSGHVSVVPVRDGVSL